MAATFVTICELENGDLRFEWHVLVEFVCVSFHLTFAKRL